MRGADTSRIPRCAPAASRGPRLVLALWLGTVLGTARAAPPAGPAPGTFDLARARIVDLTHALDEHTIFWPTETRPFALERVAFGETPGGWFYASNRFSTPEHGGTHLDAPIHFARGRHATDEIPLTRLVAPARVIDVSARAEGDPDHRLGVAEVMAHEAAHGKIPEGSIVLLQTGWSRRWPDRLRYLGDDTPGDASRLHFPGFGAPAARLLVQLRKVAALGLDTPSLDHGPSRDFPVHRIMGEADVPGFENLTALDQLPPAGAWVVALPMKIRGGSGGPLRALGLVPADENP